MWSLSGWPCGHLPSPGKPALRWTQWATEQETWGRESAPGHAWGWLAEHSHGIPTPELENEAARSSEAVRRAPRGPGLQAGAESWLRFELMLLRGSRWVPLGPFGRLQIAFKRIHPGEGERR